MHPPPPPPSGHTPAGRPLARPDRRLHDWLDDAKAGLDAAVSAIGDAITGAAQAAYASAEEKAEALMWAAFEKAVVAGPGLDPASARASAEALFNGEPIWGENCSPQYSSETWTDDLVSWPAACCMRKALAPASAACQLAQPAPAACTC